MRNAREQARAIVGVAREGKLLANIQGKQYPLLECLQLIGQMTGNTAEVEWCRKVSADEMGADGWEARAIVRDRNGQQVGAAEAMCLRSERRWGKADEYAVRSMAQTRACAKALRMRVGFIVTLAGFEPTPAEEMPDPPAPARARAAAKPPAPPIAEQRWQELQESTDADAAEIARVLKEAGIKGREALADDATWASAQGLIAAAFALGGEVVDL
jgi:hypothetical protein